MGRTRGREQPLTARARAFADAYAGKGSGVAAARAAGYTGKPTVLQVTASKLIADARVRERISARVGTELFAAWMAASAPEPATPPTVEPSSPKPPTGPLVKGRGRGTPTERIEVLMTFARAALRVKRGRGGPLPPDPEMAKVGIAAVLAAAELEGERGRTRRSGFDRPLLPPAAAPAPAPAGPPASAPTAPARPALKLFMSPEDRRHG